MRTKFQVEVENKIIRLTYGKLLGTILIDNDQVVMSLNGTSAIRGHSQNRIERKTVAIVMDFLTYAQSWLDEKPINVFFKNLERRKLFFYHLRFTPDGEIHAQKLTEEEFIDLVIPEQARGGERHNGWYIKLDPGEETKLWCYDPIDHLLVQATPTDEGVALRITSQSNDPRIDPQQAFADGLTPAIDQLHQALEEYLQKYDLAGLSGLTQDSPEAALEAIRFALRMAYHAPIERHRFNITGRGELELDVALICGFHLMKKDQQPTESCKIYYGDGHYWLYTETNVEGAETITTWEKKTMDEIVDFFQTTMLGNNAREHIAPNLLN